LSSLVTLNALPFGAKEKIVPMDFVRSNTVDNSTSTSGSASYDVMHYLPSISDLDPRLQSCYKGARTSKSPKYGLGYVEQCNSAIPPSRFTNPLPSNMSRPTTDEILKYLTVIHGCPINQFPDEWIKKMTNWDLFTNPEADDFHKSTPPHERLKLASEWKEYMKKNECWLSFLLLENFKPVFSVPDDRRNF
jgi:hypothetical protein